MTWTRSPQPAHPRASPLGTLRAFREDPLGLLLRLAREEGDVATMDMGRFRVFLLSHPDHIRDVLVANHGRFVKGEILQEPKRLLGDGLLTSEGDLHHRQRRLIQPVFHHRRMAQYVDLMVERAARATETWRDGDVVDVPDEMVRLTMSVLGKAVLDAEIGDDEARETGRALSTCLEMFGRQASPYARLLDQVSTPSTLEFERVLHVFDATVAGVIETRRATGIDGTDVLSQLMRVTDEATGEPMPDAQIRDEVLTFMVAGHETWSNSLGWTWYLLSQSPTARDALEAELAEVLGGRPPGAEDVRRLPFTGAVYSEALRLYPPAWTVGRTALEDHVVDGHRIPAGSIVLISPYVVHHDARWFPEPWAFRPERWLSEEAERIPTFAYLPFGAGPRVCIGQPLATLASVLFVSTIARRWRLDLVPGHSVEPTAPLLRPAQGIPMIARDRQARA